jgi:integrase
VAREINKLSARTVATLNAPGRHADGDGLYLVVDKGGAKRWVFLFRWRGPSHGAGAGKLREMGLGGANVVTLAQARDMAAKARADVKSGIDPIAAKKAEAPKVVTFGDAADAFIEAMKPGFRNAKHIAQWEMTLKDYAATLRALPVDQVDTEAILKVLKPIWQTKNVTASRLRGRIERVLDAAAAKGQRTGANPARWRGHLVNLLSKKQKLVRGHHKALPYAELPAFMVELRTRPATAARALEFAILTAARSGEVYNATWGEIDRAGKVWTVPAGKMKAGREHRVPLTARAISILDEMAAVGIDPADHVFPGTRRDPATKRFKPLSGMAMEMLLRRIEVDVTVHGFRSTFRDWCGEETEFPRELAEAALAHVVGDETERAYRRGDALAKRRKLMDAWDVYCATLAKRAEELFD